MQQRKESLQDYEMVEKLGQGAYGDVMLARNKHDNNLYAIKILTKRLLQKEKKQYQVFMEKEVLQRVNHPGLINLHSNFQTNDEIYFVLEFIEGGDLANFLKMNKILPPDVIVYYAAQLVCILEILHINGIAHRDVKPENIMVGGDGKLKMIDFGTATFFDQASLPQQLIDRLQELKLMGRDEREDELEYYQSKHKATFVGTAEYVSPELLEDDICGPQADLWALGCIIYKMFAGVTPFGDTTEYLVFQKIKEGHYKKSGLPHDALNLVEHLLLRDPMQRLGSAIRGDRNSYKELKEHPFFKGIEWNQLFTQELPQGFRLLGPQRKSRSSEENHERNESRKAKTIIKTEVLLTGLINKKTGWMIYKPRNMILFDYQVPKLEYFDPSTGEKKGQILLEKNVKIELLKGQFNVDVPNKKKYFFKECEHPAALWVEKIKEVMDSRK